MAKNSTRLDTLLVEQGLLPSRQAAQAAIMDGGVLVDGKKITKPGTPVRADAQLQLVGDWQSTGLKYVSRGGLKLERALQVFAVQVNDRVCLDLGASTGGFTDCLLQNGAKQVYAIDVGYGQLDWKLRQDPRVIVRERVNARYLKPDELYKDDSPVADLAVMDVSFISITKILPAARQLLKPAAEVVSLVKPQFEAGKGAVGKGGVVRDPDTHAAVLKEALRLAFELGFCIKAVTYSPIKGPAGNIEFLAHWQTVELAGDQCQGLPDNYIEEMVADAHRQL